MSRAGGKGGGGKEGGRKEEKMSLRRDRTVICIKTISSPKISMEADVPRFTLKHLSNCVSPCPLMIEAR